MIKCIFQGRDAKLKTKYILIDYENIQPTDLKDLNEDFYKIKIFIGANQTKISIDIALAMQVFNNRAEYIQILGNGKNALDFHIAYYLGNIINKDADAYYYIVSKDQGFDPLIKFLKAKKINIFRVACIKDILCNKIKKASTLLEYVDFVIKHLKGRKSSKPANLTTLTNTIKAAFQNKLELIVIEEIIKELTKKKYITIENKKITYHLP